MKLLSVIIVMVIKGMVCFWLLNMVIILGIMNVIRKLIIRVEKIMMKVG